MPRQSALLGTDSVKDSGDTVRDVIPHHIFYEERGKPDADDREYKVKPVERLHIELRSQRMLYKVNGRMKYEGSNRRKHTYKESQNKRKLLVRHVLESPLNKLIYCLIYLQFSNLITLKPQNLLPDNRNLTVACKLDDA